MYLVSRTFGAWIVGLSWSNLLPSAFLANLLAVPAYDPYIVGE